VDWGKNKIKNEMEDDVKIRINLLMMFVGYRLKEYNLVFVLI
jgi:hypothetical protein